MNRACSIGLLAALLLILFAGISPATAAEASGQDDAGKQPGETGTPAASTATPEVQAEEQEVSDADEHEYYLKRERENIERERKELLVLRTEVKKEIQAMETLRRELDVRLADLDEQRNSRIGKLVKVYQGMPTKEVALLLDNLEEDLMLDVLSRMKDKKQSQILGLMEPEKAARISRKLIDKKGN